MSRFGSDDDEMAQARARHAADEARWMREDQKAGDLMWREGERRRRSEARGSGTVQTRGDWHFNEIHDINGTITGWQARYNGKLEGMLILQEHDLICLGGSDDPYDNAPSAEEILRAFLHLYPAAPRRRLPAGQRSLP